MEMPHYENDLRRRPTTKKQNVQINESMAEKE